MTDLSRFMDFLVDIGVDFDIHNVGPFATLQLKGDKVMGWCEIYWTFGSDGAFVGTGAEE